MDFTDLHGFWGEIWPARGGWGEKMRKNVRKKTKYAQKCVQIYPAGTKMNADSWLIEECQIGWVKDKID
jgi:hypothetical protein